MHTRVTRFILACLVTILGVSPCLALAATLSVVPGSSRAAVGDTVRVSVVVNSQGAAINNAAGVLHFPADMLRVVSISTSGSVFPLWVETPGYSNETGEVNFDGGVPTPGFSGTSGTVLTVAFAAKHAGSAALSFTDSSVLANDGEGTDVLSSANAGTVAIVAADEPQKTSAKPASPPDVAPASVATSSVSSVVVTSTTNPNQSVWYAVASPSVQWNVPAGADAIKTIVDQNRSASPSVSYVPPIAEKTISDLADGIWYFGIRARVAGVWGPVSTYALRVDTTPPVMHGNSFSYDDDTGMLVVGARATDAGSGVASYEMTIDGGSTIRIAADSVKGDVVRVPYVTAGSHKVVFMAIDAAGNRSGIEGSFSVLALPSPVLDPLPARITKGDALTVSGTVSPRASEAVVYVSRNGNDVGQYRVAVAAGRFLAHVDDEKRGEYRISAQAFTKGGVESEKSAEVRVAVSDEIVLGSDSFGLTLTQLMLIVLALVGLSSVMSGVALYLIVHHLHHRTLEKSLVGRFDDLGSKIALLSRKTAAKRKTASKTDASGPSTGV